MNIAYIRVSTAEQNTGRQIEAMSRYAIDKTYEEHISGKDMNRPELQAMLSFVREGDNIYIESISRLARNTLDFLKIVELLTDKKVGLISLKEKIDTTTPQGKFMLSVFAALYQLERDNTKERQREGIDLALREGRAYGRPKTRIIDDAFIKYYEQWKAKKITATKAIESIGASRQGFYAMVKEYEQTRPM